MASSCFDITPEHGQVYHGDQLILTLFGASHTASIGMSLKGFPNGFHIDNTELQAFMSRRAPGLFPWSSSRSEPDEPCFIAGLSSEMVTNGIIKAELINKDVVSNAYSERHVIPRPSHADYPAIIKYGFHVDLRGGGIFSGRMTALLCVAGGICLQWLATKNIFVGAHIYSVGHVQDTPFDPVMTQPESLHQLGKKDFPVIDSDAGEKMKTVIMEAKSKSDSVGGTIECMVLGLKPGLGEHSFNGLESRLSSLLFSIPAVKGVEFGSGFDGASMYGSQNNDPYYYDNGKVLTKTNNAGGILGGMSTGMPLYFRIAVKPTPSIGVEQQTINLSAKCNTAIKIEGRHDPCIVPRAVPVAEAVCALVLTDMMLNEERGINK